ncbi:MAG: OmpA family protein [Burkholderiales bacterium]|nr:OmpA family protein [Burkholderiales bacterium]
MPALLGLALAAASAASMAQRPLAEASVESLVAALSGQGGGRADGPATRSFRRTQLPDAASNLCAESAKPASRAATTATTATVQRAADSGGPTRRNLEVVPYAGDSTPGVNLSVQFATGSDRLSPADRSLLDNVATALTSPALASESFAVAGHTDGTGDARINLELSCARALQVRRYLVDKGVAEARLTAYGFGSVRPLDGDAAAAANRRVELRKAPQ